MTLIRSNSSNTIKDIGSGAGLMGNNVFSIKVSNFIPQDHSNQEVTSEIEYKKELKIGDYISSYSLKNKKRIEGTIVSIERDKYNKIIEICINYNGKTISIDPTSIEIVEPNSDIQESTFLNYYEFIQSINK